VLRTGDAWPLDRLRDTLLAKNIDQRETLARRFQEFFDPGLTISPSHETPDLNALLASLARFAAAAQGRLPQESPSSMPVTQDDDEDLPIPSETDMPNDTQSGDPDRAEASAMPVPGTEEEPISWNPDGPRHFPLGAIGGTPAPRLSRERLTHLADLMSYFQSDEPGDRLDARASLNATLRQGGIPALKFLRRKRLRMLVILEDTLALALAWNPIARELAQGMARHGVPVVYGHCTQALEHFHTDDGTRYALDDFEDQRHGCLILVFSDGSAGGRYAREFSLERLARWPMAAWLDLREPRFWDATIRLPGRHGIPLYPATPAGLEQALRHFLTEAAGPPPAAAGPPPGCLPGTAALPERAAMPFELWLEYLLGDALVWAQHCAMFQPVSAGLADVLRRRFQPHLPAERLERLHRLPGTIPTVAGLWFAPEVLRALRRGFLARHSEQVQEQVLDCILEQIERVSVAAPDSLAALAQQALLERVRLERDPHYDARRLAQLAQTPLLAAIQQSLKGFGFPDDGHAIPLRLKPEHPRALERLGRIARHLSNYALLSSSFGGTDIPVCAGQTRMSAPPGSTKNQRIITYHRGICENVSIFLGKNREKFGPSLFMDKLLSNYALLSSSSGGTDIPVCAGQTQMSAPPGNTKNQRIIT
jgi:hypothetical protein